MNCEVCGTELPVGAMFCGECGRAVTPTVTRRDPDDEAQAPPALPVFGPGDTVAIDAVDLATLSPRNVGSDNDLDLEGMAVDEPSVEDLVVEEVADEPLVEPLVEPEPGASAWSPEWRTPDGALAEPEAGVDEADEADGDEEADEVEQDLPPDLDDVVPAGSSPWAASAAKVFSDAEDLEQTLIVPRREQGERFVLQFSTGESITVFGSGLLGRNPLPQPGEFFDQLVPISDPGKSVSKTHLEFGQEAGSFWVSDRFSGNGSIIREPESTPRRLSAGKRYRIVRGTRVDIAEQFFIVS